ncbi:ORF42-like protein [Bufonid herpesvirus 1]|uniref:ORF42-like protein n=1 Tax=Bufonid herpesvirus 1 TaxID=2282206 RepID=UPI000EB74CB9|nr:ORF42-like protein [Bufonid herpesvirus 1]AXF48606.1 ORF42-like protein [Bufonid herpesvirus 1]
MAIDGTKQIYTTSPAKDAWIGNLGDLRDPATGEHHWHLIAQQFKCAYHASDPEITCPCMDVYRPDHMTVDGKMKALLNMVDPGAFDFELTGCLSGATSGSEFVKPLTPHLLQRFLGNIALPFCNDQVETVYVAVDPTYSTGLLSSIGCCTIFRMKEWFSGPRFLVSEQLIFQTNG